MGSFPSARNERGILTFGNGSCGMKIENEDLDRERLSQRQLAAILGTSRRTLLNWQEAHRDTKRPMPRNADGSYHLDAVTYWMMVAKVQVDRSQQLNARARSSR
jgi:hypothetical protein